MAIRGTCRLVVEAGLAKPSPAIGQALGPLQVPMPEFVKQVNARTANLVEGTPVPVLLTAYEGGRGQFDFVTKSPPTPWLLKRCAGIKAGSNQPGREAPAGKVSVRQIFEIAKIKQSEPAVSFHDLEAVCKSVIGTARSMGLEVVR